MRVDRLIGGVVVVVEGVRVSKRRTFPWSDVGEGDVRVCRMGTQAMVRSERKESEGGDDRCWDGLEE